MFAETVSACRTLLHHAPEAEKAREYVGGRMSDYSTDKYHIGYFPDDDNLHLLYDMVDKKTIEKLRLIYTKRIQKRGYVEEADKGLFNHHSIIFPFVGEYGNIIALAGRTLLSEANQDELGISKYKNTFFNKSLHLFGLYRAKSAIEKHNCAFVVEGQMDCISCHANGLHNVVAMTGSDLSRYQVYLLKKMANKLYLLFDNDSAGDSAFKKAYKRYSSEITIERLKVPDGFKDVDQYLCESGECGLFDMC
jgi:DNA primase